MQQETLLLLCDASDVTADKPVRADAAGGPYAVFQVEGRYYVTEDNCTHGPGSLSEGYMDGATVECPFHQGCFDVRNGEPTAPPCSVPIRTWTPKLRDGKIFIDPSEQRHG